MILLAQMACIVARKTLSLSLEKKNVTIFQGNLSSLQEDGHGWTVWKV